MEKFADYMVKDVKNGECFRADHLLKGQSVLSYFILLWKSIQQFNHEIDGQMPYFHNVHFILMNKLTNYVGHPDTIVDIPQFEERWTQLCLCSVCCPC